MPHKYETIIFGRAGTLDLKLDLYKPHPFPTVSKIPAVIFYHGGGMLAGCRQTLEFQSWLIDATLSSNILFITADYRLLHPSHGPDIIADVRTLFTYLSSNPSLSSTHSLSPLPAGTTLDTTSLAVVGESGGGYPALAACIHAPPAVKPVVALLQYPQGGSILSDWYLQPKGDAPAPWRPQSEAIITRETEGVKDLFPRAGEEEGWEGLDEIAWNPFPIPVPGPDGKIPPMEPRVQLLQVFWREGTLVDLILGRVGISAELRKLPFEEREAAVPEELRGALLQAQLGGEGGTRYVFLHGTRDLIVGIEESEGPVRKLREAGREVEIVRVEGAGHVLFDPKNMPNLVEGAGETRERCWEVVREELLK